MNTFTVNGCADGVVAFAPQGQAPVLGRVACFSGTAALRLVVTPDPADPVPQLRLEPTLTAVFGPEFNGSRAVGENPFFTFAFERVGGCGVCAGLISGLGAVGTWVVGDGTPRSFVTSYDPLPRGAIIGSLRDFNGVMTLRYLLPNSPFNEFSNATVRFALTPVPEPATVGLVAAGVVVLAAAQRRRSRPTGR